MLVASRPLHILEGFPRPSGPASPKTCTPKKRSQTAFRYPEYEAARAFHDDMNEQPEAAAEEPSLGT